MAATGAQTGPGPAPVAGPSAPAPRHPGRVELREAVRGFALLWLEVEGGRRPLRLLRPLVSAELLDRLEQLPTRCGPPARVTACVGMRTGPDTYEGVVVLACGQRTTALCVTLRRQHGARGRWRVSDLGRPEAAPLPPARYAHPADSFLDVEESHDLDRSHATGWSAADLLAGSAEPLGCRELHDPRHAHNPRHPGESHGGPPAARAAHPGRRLQAC